ncbi:deoxyuridine 5'-triphosphate nucleotidohydrolase-like [Arachis stenosperma]|uniref:deoxyuridine 5'-triphosphate nucleotidohydrolase-like n=1 Tax=Arachis stenosperma TaxID=217475 RepID=UPI0025AD578E|nr:deoxyuridine 5'-triphosphate nucleotidohydrolase-like [Arachis stenosperma]
MAIFVAAVIVFVYFGGSGDYGSFEPPFSHKLSDNTVLPSRVSPLSADYDLSSDVETKIPTKGKALVATDLSISILEGTYARIAPRSGLPLKHWIDVGAGVIDADYKRPIGMILFNQSTISGLLS